MQHPFVLFLWLDGAMGQFESCDPKPGTQFGGPDRSIPTSLPGVHLADRAENVEFG